MGMSRAIGRHNPPEQIFELTHAYLGSRALMTAVELGLFDEMAGRDGMTRAEIEETFELTSHRGVRDFLDLLVAYDMLDRDGETYRPTAVSRTYLTDGESYVGDYVQLNAERMYQSAFDFREALETGEPQNELDDGETLYQDGELYATDRARDGFQEAMRSLSVFPTEWLADNVDWERYDRVAELGAAKGVLSRKIAEATETTRTVGFDLPDAEPGFRDHTGASEASDRIEFVPGDFFEDPLPEADAYTYGHILNDWDTAEKRFLVEKAYDALPADGALVIHETMLDENRSDNRFGLSMNMVTMLELQGGYCATREEYVSLLDDVGFETVETPEIPGAESVLIAHK